ncbi:unnamed protein product [Parnassius mnemosyne]|uniref:Uncharacterized protein n=1 Tax=Parnassius mnemosyne TaxID=213953 RepID=A0AAV1M4T9_9NEOP
MFQHRVGKPRSNLLQEFVPRTPAINEPTKNNSNDLRNERKDRYKIPKNIRYDLENALVSLCDVWFEEIKPYLVRNNIKVHVHDEMNKAEAPKGCVMDEIAGSKKRSHFSGATSCSHHDPGAAFDQHHRAAATSADCCSTPPTASRARSHKLRTPPQPPPPSLLIPRLQLSQVKF